MRDLYEVLGVERGASQADLKKAYRRLAQQYHPDKCPDDKDAEEKFKEAANAYQVLSDDDQRALYDRFGFDGISAAAAAVRARGFSNVEDIFSAFGDLFGDFFGGRASGGKRQPRGADLRVDLELTFAEAVWGATKDVKVTRAIACDDVQRQRRRAGQQARGLQDVPGQGPGRPRAGLLHGADARVRTVAARARRSRIRARTAAAAAPSPRRSTLIGHRARRRRRRSDAAARRQGRERRRAARPAISTSCCTSRATSGSSATATTS